MSQREKHGWIRDKIHKRPLIFGHISNLTLKFFFFFVQCYHLFHNSNMSLPSMLSLSFSADDVSFVNGMTLQQIMPRVNDMLGHLSIYSLG